LLRHAGTPLQSRRVIKPSKNAARAKLAGRSGPVTGLALDDNPEACIDKTSEILSLCHRLEKPTSEIGSWRVESSEYYIRAQNNIVELVAGKCAEQILHPDLSSLGAVHDFVEADAFAKIAVASRPAVKAPIEYCEAEASALISRKYRNRRCVG
jgi:hypothetical protein